MKKNENSVALTMARALTLVAVLPILFCATPVHAEKVEQKDSTGTDPRGFASKFMPYYLYTELGNGTKVNQFDLFGMHAFSPKCVMMYDWPVFKDVDSVCRGRCLYSNCWGPRLFGSWPPPAAMPIR